MWRKDVWSAPVRWAAEVGSWQGQGPIGVLLCMSRNFQYLLGAVRISEHRDRIRLFWERLENPEPERPVQRFLGQSIDSPATTRTLGITVTLGKFVTLTSST